MTKMQAVVSSASIMFVNLSLRRSRRLLASSQALACSTTQRTVPSPEPCGSPLLRISGRMPSAAQSLWFSRCDMRHRHRAGRSQRRPPRRGAADRETASCRAHWRRKAVPPAGCHRSPRPHDIWCPAWPCRSVWPGQLTAALGAHAATVDDHIPCCGRRFRPRANHANECGVHSVQHGRPRSTRSGVAAASRRRPDPPWPQFPPLHPFAQKEPQRFDHRLGGAARTTLIAAWPFNPVDQTGHKAACRWSHRPLPRQSHEKAGRCRRFQQPP